MTTDRATPATQFCPFCGGQAYKHDPGCGLVKNEEWNRRAAPAPNGECPHGRPVRKCFACFDASRRAAPAAPQVSGPDELLSDDAILSAMVNAIDRLDVTRFHEMRSTGWHSSTIFDGDSGLLAAGRAVESAANAALAARCGDAVWHWKQGGIDAEAAMEMVERALASQAEGEKPDGSDWSAV